MWGETWGAWVCACVRVCVCVCGGGGGQGDKASSSQQQVVIPRWCGPLINHARSQDDFKLLAENHRQVTASYWLGCLYTGPQQPGVECCIVPVVVHTINTYTAVSCDTATFTARHEPLTGPHTPVDWQTVFGDPL